MENDINKCVTMIIKTEHYKGYGINKNVISREYTASSYANPTFYGRNIAKIKRAINQYLKDERYTDTNEVYHIK